LLPEILQRHRYRRKRQETSTGKQQTSACCQCVFRLSKQNDHKLEIHPSNLHKYISNPLYIP
jgi:hypothetical protein